MTWKLVGKFIEARCHALNNGKPSFNKTSSDQKHKKSTKKQPSASVNMNINQQHQQNQTYRQGKQSRNFQQQRQSPTNANYQPQRAGRCLYCQYEGHRLRECDQFRRLSHQGKLDAVKHANLCFNCLSPTHRRDQCDLEKSGTCRKCRQTHHTCLYEAVMHTNAQRPQQRPQQAGPGAPAGPSQQVHSHLTNDRRGTVLLASASSYYSTTA